MRAYLNLKKYSILDMMIQWSKEKKSLFLLNLYMKILCGQQQSCLYYHDLLHVPTHQNGRTQGTYTDDLIIKIQDIHLSAMHSRLNHAF